MENAINVSIRAVTLNDKRKIFNWLANSNITQEMLGAPKFPDNPVPTWEEYDEDYKDYYFDYVRPYKGQCFIILNNLQEVGQINYNPINRKTKTTEFDIWLADKKYTGKGIGTAAIKLLCALIFENLDCDKILIQPSARNKFAIRAYKKVGFIEQPIIPKGFELDYYDSVLLGLTSE